jgi:hypothetical protein
MAEAAPEDAKATEADAGDEDLSGDALDLDGLKARGDVGGLLTLARAYRSGKAPGGRDMKRCFDAYRAAAELGSGDAEYAVALFCMSGGIIPQDLKEGATRLRAAAEKGNVPAKVYLGNLYELGIHYKADPEKADVWYRNAARGARIVFEPNSEEYENGLAELGCARHVLARVERGTLNEEDKTRLVQRARAHGYGLRLKDGSEPSFDGLAPRADDNPTDRATFLDALQKAEASAAVIASPTKAHAGDHQQRAPRVPETKSAKAQVEPRDATKTPGSKEAAGATSKAAPKLTRPSRFSIGIGAFGYATLFAIAGAIAGYAAMNGARELVAHGTRLPALGTRTDLVFPIVLAVVGVLPTWLVYRLGTVIKALLVAAFVGGIGWVAWGTGQAAFLALRPVQAMAFALAGFLAALMVLGLVGGTKRQPARDHRAQRHPSG